VPIPPFWPGSRSEAFFFGNGKREEAKPGLAAWSHGIDLGRFVFVG
jgi:hypothetical protein